MTTSEFRWKRLRNFIITVSLLLFTGAVIYNVFFSGKFHFDVEGVIMKEHVAVSSPYSDTHIKKVFVNRGDIVQEGQKIAQVESIDIIKALSLLSLEKVHLQTKIVETRNRISALVALTPEAQENSDKNREYLRTIQNNTAVTPKTVADVSSLSFGATEKLKSILSEKLSLEESISLYCNSLDELSKSFRDIENSFASGFLYASRSGVIGSRNVEGSNNTLIAEIYYGKTFVTAFLPSNFLFNVSVGDKVTVTGRQQTQGVIEEILPITDQMPPEFQLPTHSRDRGQVLKIAIDNENYPLGEKVRITKPVLGLQ